MEYICLGAVDLLFVIFHDIVADCRKDDDESKNELIRAHSDVVRSRRKSLRNNTAHQLTKPLPISHTTAIDGRPTHQARRLETTRVTGERYGQ